MDAATLAACTGSSLPLAQRWEPSLTQAMSDYGITTPKRQAAFLAQIGHESLGLFYTKEIWGPTAAQRGYEGRDDLGNTEEGDGERFMGRGFIQVTGRKNYTAVAGALCLDCVNRPELLEQEPWPAVTAAWWWGTHGCNELADQGSFTAITRIINGGLNGLADRQNRWLQAKKALGVL